MVYLVPYRAIHRKRRYQEPNWFARVASINSSEVCTQIRFRLKFKIHQLGSTRTRNIDWKAHVHSQIVLRWS